MNNKIKELYMYIFGALLMLYLFCFLGLVLFKAIPAGNENIVYTSAGVAFGWGSAVVYYFFGSSKGSSDKNEMIRKNGNNGS